jgi:O-antigen/teichoic acid export membrane protein
MSEAAQKVQSLTARAFWLMAAKTLAFVFAFALPVLLTRRLSQDEYGLFKQVFLVVSTATAVLPLGFGMSAYYFLPRETDPERRARVVFNVLLFSLAAGGAACLALVLWPGLLARVFGDPALVPFAPVVGLVILLWLVSSFLEIVTVANQEVRAATLFIVGAQLARTSLMFGAALVFGTVGSLVYAALAQGALQTIALVWYLRSRFGRFWQGFDAASFATQASYALPLGFAGLLYSLMVDLHNYFVSNRFSPAVFAVYSVGVAQLPLVNILRESVSTVMIPRVSQLQKQGETRQIVALLANAMRKLAAAYLPLFAFLMVAGREFLVVLFTEAYAASWPIFAINLLLLPLSLLEFDAVIRAYAEHRYFMLKLRAVLFAVMIFALWFGVLRFGVVGAIGVVVAINFVERALTAVKFGRVIGVRLRDLSLLGDVLKIACAALLAGLVALLVRALVLAHLSPLLVLMVAASVFAPIYFGAVALFGVLTEEERGELRRRAVELRRRAPWGRAPGGLQAGRAG